MRVILFLFWFFCFGSINAQDSLCLKSGNCYLGKVVLYSPSKFIFKSNGIFYKVRTNDVLNKSVVFQNIDTNTYYPIKDTHYHLVQAGNAGIASIVLMLVGGAISGIGAGTNKPMIIYTGAGIGGAAIIPLGICFGQLIKSGRSYEYPLLR